MSEPVVSIRPYRLGDAVDCYEAVMESMENLSAFSPWAHPNLTLEHQVAWVQSKVKAFEEQSDFEFVILSADGTFLGSCGLGQVDKVNRRANLGYWVRSAARRRGTATAATRLLVKWGLENTDLQRLEVIVSTRNHPSLRVAEKAGASREGVLKSRLLLHGEWHDAAIYSFVRG